MHALTSPLYKSHQMNLLETSAVEAALQKDATARRILQKGVRLQQGQLVGVRLNLNVLKTTGCAVHTVHKATSLNGHKEGKGFYRGEVIGYLPVVELRDAFFNVSQAGRQAIASGGQAKFPMASVDGVFHGASNADTCDGIEVSFNPKAVHLFVDANACAVQYAEHVTVVGHRIYARGEVRYYSAANAPAPTGNAPSAVRFLEGEDETPSSDTREERALELELF